MDQNRTLPSIRLILLPAALLLLGLVLLFSPDSASAFLSKLLGWIFTGCSIVVGISALSARRVSQLLCALLLLCSGLYLISNPLALAQLLGRLLGLILLINFLPSLIQSHKEGHSLPRRDLILCIVAVVLILLPMAASRLLFKLCGILLLILGAGMLAHRLRKPLPLENSVIDADE